MKTRGLPMAECFPALIEPDLNSGCWLWAGSVGNHGYALIWDRHRQRNKLVSHLSWEMARGPIPTGDGYHGTCLCHRCDTPLCVNPDHLFLGTQADNVRDRVNKGRSRHHTGERHHGAKLTWAKVRELRRLYESGQANQRELADRFGISPTNARLIIIGEAWKETAALKLMDHPDAG